MYKNAKNKRRAPANLTRHGGIKYNMFMEKTARLTIRESADGEPVLVTTGKIVRIGNSLNLTYGDAETAFVIGISDGMVSISRQGEEDYSLVLCEGKEYAFDISSPYGVIPMRVVPKLVEFDETAAGLSVRLAYDLVGGDERQSFGLFLDCVYED